MGGPVMDLEWFIPALLTFVANRLSSTGSAAYMRAFGIGVMEFRILVTLAVEENIRAVRIADIIGLDKGAVSRTLKALQKRGLVIAGAPPGSRRLTYVLSDKGRVVHDGAMVIADQRQELLLEGIGRHDRERIAGLLRTMLGNIGKLKAHSETQQPRAAQAPRGKSRTLPVSSRKKR